MKDRMDSLADDIQRMSTEDRESFRQWLRAQGKQQEVIS